MRVSEGSVFIGFIAGLAIWAFAVLPWLYGPAPRFSESDHPPKAHSENSKTNSASKPDGTEAAPFFIRIPKTAEEAAQEAEDRKEKATTDWWLMVFTGAVAIFTLALVGATTALYIAGEKQLAIAKLAADAAKKSADASLKSIELSTSPSFTWLLESIRNVVPGDSPTVRLKVHNVGSGVAYSVGFSTFLSVFSEEDLIKPVKLDIPKSQNVITPVNDHFFVSATLKSKLTKKIIDDIQDGRLFLYAWGALSFEPINADARVFSFCIELGGPNLANPVTQWGKLQIEMQA